MVGDGNFGRCHTRQRTYGKVLVAILGRLRSDAVLQIYRGAIADDIASSFTEQMEAIERQIGINDDNRMKENGCCCRDDYSSSTTTTTTLYLMRIRNALKREEEDDMLLINIFSNKQH